MVISPIHGLFFFGLIHPFDFAQGDEPKNQGKNMLPPSSPTTRPHFFRSGALGFALAGQVVGFVSLSIHCRSPITVHRLPVPAPPLGCLPFENLRAGESPRRQDYDSILLTVCSWPGIYAGLCMIYAWCMLKSLRPYATYMPPVSRGYAGRKPAACRR